MAADNIDLYQKSIPSLLESLLTNRAVKATTELENSLGHLRQFPSTEDISLWEDNSNFRGAKIEEIRSFLKTERDETTKLSVNPDKHYDNKAQKTFCDEIEDVISNSLETILKEDDCLIASAQTQTLGIEIVKNSLFLLTYSELSKKITTRTNQVYEEAFNEAYFSFMEDWPFDRIIKDSTTREHVMHHYRTVSGTRMEEVNLGRALYDDYGPEEIIQRPVSYSYQVRSGSTTLDSWKDIGVKLREVEDLAKNYASKEAKKVVLEKLEKYAKQETGKIISPIIQKLSSNDLPKDDILNADCNDGDVLDKAIILDEISEISDSDRKNLISQLLTNGLPTQLRKDLEILEKRTRCSRGLNYLEKNTLSSNVSILLGKLELVSQSCCLVDSLSDWEDDSTIPGSFIKDFHDYLSSLSNSNLREKEKTHQTLIENIINDGIQNKLKEFTSNVNDNYLQSLPKILLDSVVMAITYSIKNNVILDVDYTAEKQWDESYMFHYLSKSADFKSGLIRGYERAEGNREHTRDYEDRIHRFCKSHAISKSEDDLTRIISPIISKNIDELFSPYFTKLKTKQLGD